MEYVVRWKGVPIEQLPPAEMLEALKFALEEVRRLQADRDRMWPAVDKVKYLMAGAK